MSYPISDIGLVLKLFLVSIIKNLHYKADMDNLTYPSIDYFLRSMVLFGPVLALLFFKKRSQLTKFFILWIGFYLIGLFYGVVVPIYLRWELEICNAGNGVTSPDQTAEPCLWLLERISSDTGRSLFPITGIFTGLIYALLLSVLIPIISSIKGISMSDKN